MRRPIPIKQLTILAMLSALSYIVMFFGRIPVILFLKYEAKDVVIAIGGFLYGPISALTMSVVVSIVEMLLASDTGWIGCIMNILSTCAFVCPAALIYRKMRTIKGGVIGLAVGVLAMTAVMILWNYLLTPLFMNTPRADVVAMLIPVFLPFNLIKGGLNAAITVLLYKPVITALRKQHLLPAAENAGPVTGKARIGVVLTSCFVIVTCVLLILSYQGRI